MSRPNHPSVHRKRLKLAFKCAVTVSLLTVVASSIGYRQIFSALLSADVGLVAIAASIGMLTRYIQAHQMSTIMGRAGMSVSSKRVMLANSLSALYAMVVPGDVLASVAKWANLSDATGNKSGVLNAIVYNRLVQFLPWLIFGLIALAIDNPLGQQWLTIASSVMLVVPVVGLMMAFSQKYGPRIDAVSLRAVETCLPRFLGSKLASLVSALGPFREFSLRFHCTMLLVSIGAAAVAMVSFIVMARAAHIDAPILLLVWTRALITLLRMLPISINGIGVRETTLVAVLGRHGVSEAAAFSFGILSFLNLLAAAFVGACYQLILTLRATRPGTENTSPVTAEETQSFDRFRSAA